MPEQGSSNYDKLYKIRPLLYLIVTAFKSAYIPGKNIAVDESLIEFKGRLSWIQYMLKNPTKWGIKVWVAADSVTVYV